MDPRWKSEPKHYARNGVTILFAAFNIDDGTVISEIRRHHRAAENQKFPTVIDKVVPDTLDAHIVCDKLSTHKSPAIKAWNEDPSRSSGRRRPRRSPPHPPNI